MNQLYVRILLVAAIAVGAGCGIVAANSARQDMESSKVAYKDCLQKHPSDTAACEGARLAYEADLRAYRATSSSLKQGTTVDVNQ